MESTYFVFAGHGFDSRHFPPLGIFASGGPDVDHGVVLELVGAVEDAATVVGADHREFPVLEWGRA